MNAISKISIFIHKYKNIFFIITFICLLITVELSWYPHKSYTVLMGDDLSVVNATRENNFLRYFSKMHGGSKFRPIFEIPFYFLAKTAGSNLDIYLKTNIFLDSLNIILIFFIILTLTKKNYLIASVGSLLIPISRFNSYQHLQLFGIMENMAILFFLFSLYLSLKILKKDRNDNSLIFLFILTLTLTTFTHERFLFLIFPAALLMIFKFINQKKSKYIILTLIILSVAFFNILIKKLLGINFLSGAGGSTISLNYYNIFNFSLSGMANMFGLNYGPSYLSSLSFEESSRYIQYLGYLIFISCVILISSMIYIKRRSISIYLLLLSYFLSLILSASIAFRQEYRWLYSPFMVFIVIICFLNSSIKNKLLKTFFIIFFFFSQIIISFYYRNQLNNIYFMPGIKIASEAKKKIIDRYNGSLNNAPVYLVTNSNDINWYFMNDLFFKYYLPNTTIKLFYTNQEFIKKIEFDKLKNFYVFKIINNAPIIDETKKFKNISIIN